MAPAYGGGWWFYSCFLLAGIYFKMTLCRNNDEAPKCCPCAPAYGGGWWFYSCFESNLNGEYFTDPKAE